MTTYRVKRDIENERDQDALRKGRCPWCLEKLTPVFDARAEHVADQCDECKDRFEP